MHRAPILLLVALSALAGAHRSMGAMRPSAEIAGRGCPFHSGLAAKVNERAGWPKAQQGFREALARIDFEAVKQDLKIMFKTSQPFWPADYGNYAPFFIRLAWHNAGSYRTYDGRGGADGGRQRFDPERSWPDNTNLDKARTLLQPIKIKYGLGLSWGDLIILAGTTAIESMGGPVLGFCGGRIDDENGEWSQELGPTPEQQALFPCAVNGQCKAPLGSTTIGLIYLNPEGPMGQPIPADTAGTIRDSFGRMNMNDTETVALIGGGHAFGKTHGACPKGAGPSPAEDPSNPWPGLCGTGKGVDAFTSGFEGPWTANPTQWDNQYFHLLTEFDWEKYQSPGAHWTWRIVGGKGPLGPSVNGTSPPQHVMMMTSDVSLKFDPMGNYQKIIQLYADQPAVFSNAFSHAWYKLTTRDMGPVTRCVGNNVPPAQDWQNPLPAPVPPAELPDFAEVKGAVNALLPLAPEIPTRLVRLAYQCSSTFRVTDYLGGCNGARIRFSPQKDWPENSGLDTVLSRLQPIQTRFRNLSWADLIVLAGNAALEYLGAPTLSFCPGRTDASAGADSDNFLVPRVRGQWPNDTALVVKDYYRVMGLTQEEWVALMAKPFDDAYLVQRGFKASGLGQTISNNYFKVLLTSQWEVYNNPTTVQYHAVGTNIYLLQADLQLKFDAELMAISQNYAADNTLFLKTFTAAWTKLANSDRFNGPTGSLCP